MPHASDVPSPRTAALLLAALSGCTLLPPSDAGRRLPQGRVEILQNREYSARARAYLNSAHRPSYFVAGNNDRFAAGISDERKTSIEHALVAERPQQRSETTKAAPFI